MKTIVLNAGHGGRDPGAVNNRINLRESDAVLRVCLACRDHLNENYSGHRLVLPRNTDIFVGLPTRRDITRREGGDLYVSMHMNAFHDTSANGFETFTLNGPVYEETRRNQDIIHKHIMMYLSTLGIRDRGQKRSRHWEPVNVPASVVLVEYLFVSNDREGRHALDMGKCKAMGVATAEGIAEAMRLKRKQFVEPIEEGIFYRVIAGSYQDRRNAELMCENLRRQGIAAFIDIQKI